MDYLNLLNNSHEKTCLYGEDISRLDYLAENIFDFTTYDSEMGELFGKKAIEVCVAISNKQTYEYQKNEEDYKWYLLMVNMPFFTGKLEWGGSIRGAWWNLHKDDEFVINSGCLWQGNDQLLELRFNFKQWKLFINAVSDFASVKTK